MDKRRRKQVEPVVMDQLGRVPPNDEKTERAIIGAILFAYKDIPCQKVLQSANPEHFYTEPYRIVYSAMKDLWSNDEPVDILSVTNYLRRTGELETIDAKNQTAKDGALYIMTLTNGIAGSSNVNYWFHSIIYPLFLRRKIIEVSARAYESGYDDTADTFDELDNLIDELDKLDE